PEIETVADCPYRCDPDGAMVCERCAIRIAAGEVLPRQQRRVPLVELPIGATEDRVVGTLNLEQAIKEGERLFEPGLLAAANRGILYVDEVNLLGDHLVDVLLDAAAMGQNYVEREGISVTHPSQFILIGTMNPEEGELRPQLLDRFALAVSVEGMRDPAERAEVVRRRIAFEADPVGFAARWRAVDDQYRDRISAAQALLPEVRIDDRQLDLISRICIDFAIDGLRGDIVMYKAAIALAADAGRRHVLAADIQEAAELALPHRKRRQPFDEPDDGHERLEELVRQHTDDSSSANEPDGDREPTAEPNNSDDPADDPGDDATRGGEALAAPARTFPPSATFPIRQFEQVHQPPARSVGRVRSGRRTTAISPTPTGHFVGTRLPTSRPGAIVDLALDATMRAAAPHQLRRRALRPDGPRMLIAPADFRERVREMKIGNLVVFAVDASGSMGARQRMVAVKGAALSLLRDAYQKRDRVALVAFRREAAELLLPPTNSVALAERQLRSLPTGGRTPLAHALQLCDDTLQRYQKGQRHDVSWLILISDGRPNVPLAGGDALQDAYRMAERLREHGVRALVIDSENGPVRLGQNHRLAEALGADYFRLEEVAAGAIAATVRQRLGLTVTSRAVGGEDIRWAR
ncbi:MAG TPA: VWA domain-containing protein, partial [Candidatus Saccharimonadales bacterium]|nr:VWA domain-containing protein [Candidatus Saccharimonadales bacterium]